MGRREKDRKSSSISDSGASAVEIYIGNPVEHESERSTLQVIERVLAADNCTAVVFANFSVLSRQIDILVARDGLTLVIEAKSGTRAVRGCENGPWQVHVGSGDWQDFPNPYHQVLDAAFAIKDAMRRFTDGPIPYVAAALVFAPEIPRGSQTLQSDRKVSVMGHDGLRERLWRRGRSGWSGVQWRAFGRHLRLTRVSSIAAACSPALVEAEDHIREYATNFCRTYQDAESLIPFGCKSEGESISSSDVTDLVLEHRCGLFLDGPSGCGKSMLAASSGTALVRRGGVAVTVQSKEFDGGIKVALDREVGLLGTASTTRLLHDARLLGKPILFIVDGYNECPADRQPQLTRAVAALARKFEAGVLVTSQIPLAKGDLLDLRKVDVSPPTMETKAAIAEQASEGRPPRANTEKLLAAVSTGLEARLAGEIGTAVRPGSSRYALFDAYARHRLGDQAGECIRALALVAAWMFERLVFSMSVRDFDRVMDCEGVSPMLRRLILEKRLLMHRGDRVSFPHEMFFDAFAAEAVVRQAEDRPKEILKALAAPLHANRKDLVIGAIDDDSVLAGLLPILEDSGSVKACLQGRSGSRALEWAERYCGELWSRVREEARGACFSIGSRGWEGVEFDWNSLTSWSPCDQAFLSLLTEIVANGRYREEALEVIGILDQRIAEEWIRLRNETGINDTKLRNGLFAISFAIPALSPCAPSISWVCARIGNAVGIVRMDRFRSPKDAVPPETHQILLEGDLSQGQLYFLLELSRGGEIPASYLARTIDSRWDSAPYHLRLALLNAAAMNSTGDEADRAKLIEAVEELMKRRDSDVPDIVLETLQMLGALDNDAREHRDGVLKIVRECLARPADRDGQVQAWIVYYSQFEHPYSAAYCEVVSELGNGDRKMLLEMAAEGVRDTSFWLTPLLIDLASIGDRNSGGSIARWSRVPEAEDRVMPQEDIAVFVVAHIALARLGCPLPDKQIATGSASAEALAACGAILYWINRSDLRVDERLTECGQALGVLEKQAKGLALDVVCECEYAVYGKARRLPEEGEKVRSIVGTFPAETAAICRIGLLHPRSQIGYFSHFGEHDRQRNIGFAIGVLKDHGSVMDRPLLGRYASSGEYGRDAIAALGAIEEREMGNAGGIA